MTLSANQFAPISLLLLVVLSLSGCAAAKQDTTGQPMTSAPNVRSVSLVYRTGSDRLNMASGAWARNAQFASHGRPPASMLPNMTMAQLHIQSPHPSGYPDSALVTLIVRPPSQNSDGGGKSFWKRIVPWSGKASHGDEPSWGYSETWTLDIPQWQLDTIVKNLHETNFFLRARVLSPNSYIEVDEDGARFGKRYKAVPALDSLIMQARTAGRSLHPATSYPRHHQPMEPGASVANRPSTPSHWYPSNSYPPPGPTYNQPLYNQSLYNQPPYNPPPYNSAPYGASNLNR